MFELYLSSNSVVDPYMAIIDNPDREMEGHKPYYDISITPEGGVAHGSQWDRREVINLRNRAAADYSNSGASYAFKRIAIDDAPEAVQKAILKELESEI